MKPATNRQVPDNAILDKLNKQVYLGNQFFLNTDVVALADSSEAPLLYVSNPALTTQSFPNGVSIFNGLQRFCCNDPTGLIDIVFRIYHTPTGIAAGSAKTPVNARFANTNASIAAVKQSPTAVTKGTLMATYFAGWPDQVVSDAMIVIDPGKSILITAQASAAVNAMALLSWYEI